ncbi:MAG: CHAT domain-containing protein, partial [Anaerolineales bacterium]|nr:CHAT domain-containing protein [Anaerolineales bacterium]
QRRKRQYYVQSVALKKQYDDWLDRYHRQQQILSEELPVIPNLTLTQFRHHAYTLWQNNWLSLNYFITQDSLFISLTTSDAQQTLQQPLNQHQRHLIQRAQHHAQTMSIDDWASLGHTLLPSACRAHLAPNKVLIIIPHNILHHIPWPLLYLNQRPLISQSIPLVLPSLTALSQLLNIAKPTTEATQGMLLIGIEAFANNRYKPLPATKTEIQALTTAETATLVDQQATWQQLKKTIATRPPFIAWHLATHAFFDSYTNGRMSGFALYDKDIWLEEIEELAHTPPLIFLSACSSLATNVYSGDEQISLALSFLQQSTQSVIGSLWEIEDGAAQQLTASFYHYWQGTTTAVEALTLAQRQAYQNQLAMPQWGGFRLIGTGHQTRQIL